MPFNHEENYGTLDGVVYLDRRQAELDEERSYSTAVHADGRAQVLDRENPLELALPSAYRTSGFGYGRTRSPSSEYLWRRLWGKTDPLEHTLRMRRTIRTPESAPPPAPPVPAPRTAPVPQKAKALPPLVPSRLPVEIIGESEEWQQGFAWGKMMGSMQLRLRLEAILRSNGIPVTEPLEDVLKKLILAPVDI